MEDEELDDMLKKPSASTNDVGIVWNVLTTVIIKYLEQGRQRYSRFRNQTYENLALEIDKQKKRDKKLSWKDREIFVDSSRAVGVTIGETDTKKALDQRKKQLLKEKRNTFSDIQFSWWYICAGKYGLEIEEEGEKLSWENYYDKVQNIIYFYVS